ncbi:hypothetical protein JAAARDRAFT_179948 [Jaapia argillacea MUCL 33604]|uniref:Uncharacterized protein n=1 Tax=Jaapia argillacea MUCL 33604 TaxID=933084 RepID=A0A067Q1E2_9AGAM|nr:hypothetical protein JAAARDRAFT_179948 [Jaapia argillacea MUCL 33604]
MKQIGKKPVIYLFPPKPMEIRVMLGLVPQWEFSALFPDVLVEQKALVASQGRVGQTVAWEVSAQPNGVIRDKNGMEVSYLYWEAEVRRADIIDSPPAIPPLSQSVGDEVFDPSHPILTPGNSVVLSTHSVPIYLDNALRALGLHIEARTSFITFWIPDFNEHPYVQLRFLPQQSYSVAAPLEITPRPDAILRVFMLWKGISEEDRRQPSCDQAASRADRPVDWWKDIVGIEDDERIPGDLFRVIEWGGMQVY